MNAHTKRVVIFLLVPIFILVWRNLVSTPPRCETVEGDFPPSNSRDSNEVLCTTYVAIAVEGVFAFSLLGRTFLNVTAPKVVTVTYQCSCTPVYGVLKIGRATVELEYPTRESITIVRTNPTIAACVLEASASNHMVLIANMRTEDVNVIDASLTTPHTVSIPSGDTANLPLPPAGLAPSVSVPVNLTFAGTSQPVVASQPSGISSSSNSPARGKVHRTVFGATIGPGAIAIVLFDRGRPVVVGSGVVEAPCTFRFFSAALNTNAGCTNLQQPIDATFSVGDVPLVVAKSGEAAFQEGKWYMPCNSPVRVQSTALGAEVAERYMGKTPTEITAFGYVKSPDDCHLTLNMFLHAAQSLWPFEIEVYRMSFDIAGVEAEPRFIWPNGEWNSITRLRTGPTGMKSAILPMSVTSRAEGGKNMNVHLNITSPMRGYIFYGGSVEEHRDSILVVEPALQQPMPPAAQKCRLRFLNLFHHGWKGTVSVADAPPRVTSSTSLGEATEYMEWDRCGLITVMVRDEKVILGELNHGDTLTIAYRGYTDVGNNQYAINPPTMFYDATSADTLTFVNFTPVTVIAKENLFIGGRTYERDVDDGGVANFTIESIDGSETNETGLLTNRVGNVKYNHTLPTRITAMRLFGNFSIVLPANPANVGSWTIVFLPVDLASFSTGLVALRNRAASHEPASPAAPSEPPPAAPASPRPTPQCAWSSGGRFFLNL